MAETSLRSAQPLVSIITPVYNGEQYLRDCIESVQAQTYGNWEHVIVDNCSTDGTAAIAAEYAARDPRIRVHRNDTLVRVIPNFNIAFRQISPASTYCKPVAADDMIFPECVEKMVALAEQHPTVAIVGSYGVYSHAPMGVYGRGVPYGTARLEGRALARSYLLADESGPSVFGAPTFTLFRASVLRQRPTFYNESNIHADSEACLALMENHDFGFVHQILTFTRVRDESVTAMSQDLNTYLPYRLEALQRYGPRFLSADEVEREIHSCLHQYYRFLAWQTPKRRSRKFWQFHRGKLAAAGFPLSRPRLAAQVAGYVFRKLAGR